MQSFEYFNPQKSSNLNISTNFNNNRIPSKSILFDEASSAFTKDSDFGIKPTSWPSTRTSSFGDVYSSRNQDELLDGWKENMDPNSGRLYYENSYTKQRQWKRPVASNLVQSVVYQNNPAIADGGIYSGIRKVPSVERVLNAESLICDTSYFRPIAPAPPVAESKAVIARMQLASMLKVACDYDMLTISDMEKLTSQKKCGYLLKQSKYLGRWLKRYVVLASGSILYDDTPRPSTLDIVCPKRYEITGSTSVKYMNDRCIAIKGLTRNQEPAKPLVLIADNVNELKEWVTSICSHIHAQYKFENNITSDYWDSGDVAVSFWKLPTINSHSKKQASAIDIRTLPYSNAPKTGDTIYPGETIEIVQTLDDGHGHIMLRLADDRGWICDANTITSTSMECLKGCYVEENRSYYYPTSQSHTLKVYSGPCMMSNSIEKISITPGSTFQSCAKWVPSVNDVCDKDKQESITFVKLTSSRLWVAIGSNTAAAVFNLSKGSTKLYVC